jgi:hypothetical protein
MRRLSSHTIHAHSQAPTHRHQHTHREYSQAPTHILSHILRVLSLTVPPFFLRHQHTHTDSTLPPRSLSGTILSLSPRIRKSHRIRTSQRAGGHKHERTRENTRPGCEHSRVTDRTSSISISISRSRSPSSLPLSLSTPTCPSAFSCSSGALWRRTRKNKRGKNQRTQGPPPTAGTR